MKQLLLAIIILYASDGFCQTTIKVDQYIFPVELNGQKILKIEMPFGQSTISTITGDTINLQTATDIFVDVVCTDYPSGYSLNKLNQERLKIFLQRFPFLENHRLAEVSFFRQLNGAQKEQAESMFHGLIIRYRPQQTKTAMQADLDSLEELLNIYTIHTTDTLAKQGVLPENRDSIIARLRLKNGLPLKKTGPAKYEKKPYDMSATGYPTTGYRHSTADSFIIISPKDALKKKLISKAAYKSYDWTDYVTLYFKRIEDNPPKKETIILAEKLTVTDTTRNVVPLAAPDSTLLKIFSRVEWKNFTIVGDVTVSMYPYSAQLLLWISLHPVENGTGDFVFFNDGNEMLNEDKKIGSTGGIYPKTCNSFTQVKNMIRETMEKGSGGDRAENDIEALLEGEKIFPENDFQVLIADNWAPVKDKILSHQLTKPVRIILCGADLYHVEVDYLNLARQTKGSLHISEKDFYNLDAIKEGEFFKIGKKTFQITNNYFVETASTDHE